MLRLVLMLLILILVVLLRKFLVVVVEVIIWVNWMLCWRLYVVFVILCWIIFLLLLKCGVELMIFKRVVIIFLKFWMVCFWWELLVWLFMGELWYNVIMVWVVGVFLKRLSNIWEIELFLVVVIFLFFMIVCEWFVKWVLMELLLCVEWLVIFGFLSNVEC